ncbi:MAG: carboxypeptidase-like regulatory domain-containing protein, partial [Acidobacteriota bacterium]|nr:carboxypeptidase-like regulatory domain-containing protein [Acidobacteriota bacterium]
MFNKKAFQKVTIPLSRKKISGKRINQRFLKTVTCLMTLLSFIFLTATAFGQSGAASLTGIILDASGGVVPGASVVIRNVGTGVETKTTSSNTGNYTFPSLPI